MIREIYEESKESGKTNKEPTVPGSSSGVSVLTQLIKDVRVPSEKEGHKCKKITLESLGISEMEAIALLNKHPRADILKNISSREEDEQ